MPLNYIKFNKKIISFIKTHTHTHTHTRTQTHKILQFPSTNFLIFKSLHDSLIICKLHFFKSLVK